MKFTEVKTLEHLLKQLKEYATPVGQQSTNNTGIGSNAKSQGRMSQAVGSMGNMAKNMSKSMVKGKDSKLTQRLKSVAGGVQGTATSIANPGQAKKQNTFVSAKAKDLQKDTEIFDKTGKALGTVDSPLGDDNFGGVDAVAIKNSKGEYEIKQPDDEMFISQTNEGKLSKLANRKNKKLRLRKLKGKIKKLSRRRLKEADPKLFEINFNQTSIAKDALDAPVKCGFEAETFFYSVESNSASDDVDNMSISDIEYEYGDLPDRAYEDYRDWLYEKGQEEYLEDLIIDKVEEVKEDEEYLNDFIDSGAGPSSEAIERYKENFEEENPKEYENREEDGWEYMNWVREYVEEEYEEEYLDWLKEDVVSEFNLDDEATEAAESDYTMDEWVSDNYSYMSSFLDDYGHDYSRPGGDVENVADELMVWIRDNSNYPDYPESGDYGETNTISAWSVEADSSIEPDEGTGAELISPVFQNPREMMTEMKSLFDWSERNFGTNRSTGLHVTMSWHGEAAGLPSAAEPNKLKMALLLGDPYLLAEFGRLKNSYTKSQYNSVLKYAEGMKRGDAKSFEQFEEMLSKGISNDKFNSIHFKSEKDRMSGTNLIEFRIAGGEDYQTMYEKVVKAVVRYSTVMRAGYDESAFRKDYVNAVFKLLRKSQEIDPNKAKDFEARGIANHKVIDSAKNIVGKKDYFDVIQFLSSSVEYLEKYNQNSQPNADKEWKQSIKDYQKNTGNKVEIDEVEQRTPATGFVKPDSIAPSRRAASELKNAQDRFASAITILSRDIADGNARGPVSAKDIGIFRNFAKDVQLDDKGLENALIQKMDDFNLQGTDKEKLARLKKGADKIFKKDLIAKPTYITPQALDGIANGMWQFYQTDDKINNTKLDALADLLVKLNPMNNKNDVLELLRELKHQRSQNGFVSKLKGGGWGSTTTLLGTGKVTTPGTAKELMAFLEPYKGYEHPTGKDHHVNINSDDPYADIAQMALVQKIRHRLDHLEELKSDDKDKYNKIKVQLVKIGTEFINTISSVTNDVGSVESVDLGHWALQLNSRRTETALDFLTRAKSLEEDDLYNFVRAYDDYIIREPLSMLRDHYQAKTPGAEYSDVQKNPIVKKLIKKSFAGIKKFLSAFDEIFTAEGFTDLKAEISNKDQYDKRNKDFEKNVRSKTLATLNVPAHSNVYTRDTLVGNLEDVDLDEPESEMTQWFNNTVVDHIKNKINRGDMIWVIPASHWDDATDALEGLNLIEVYEQQKNYYHTWRKTDYRRVLSKFRSLYGINWEELSGEDEFSETGGERLYSELKNLGIEVTHEGDSRKGAPGQKDLLDAESTKNPLSGEPLNRSSSTSWEMNDEDAEQKRFEAFDWSLYPEKMKSVVAQVMQNDRYGSFRIALEEVLQKVVNKELNLDVDIINAPSLKRAAGVDDMEGEASNSISRKTNWEALAEYVGIEAGVNNQGINIFKKVYDQFDSEQSSIRSGHSMERWIGCVKDAVEYVKKNYKVSGGNYFRIDSDGNVGDDVRDVYSTPDQQVNTDYDKARADHPGFDRMMQRGMQDYLARGQVNDLVGFLNNPSNDNVFKSQVLNTITNRGDMENGPFASFQDALAVTRRQGNESVFKKFDNLSLQEQLEHLGKIDKKKIDKVYEGRLKNAWMSGDYKEPVEPIVAPNPMAIKKKYNPAEHKENVIQSIMSKQNISRANATMQVNAMVKRDPNYFTDKSKVDESVPNNTTVRVLNTLLAEPMPAHDIKKQMDAYFAIPVPQMLKDFRYRAVEGGPDICLRSILRNYIQQNLNPRLHTELNLTESKDDLIAKLDAMPEDESTVKLINYIEQLIDDMGVGGKIRSLSNQLEIIPDVDVKKSVNQIAKIIASIEMSPTERAQLFVDWKADRLVNVDALLSTSTVSLETIFNGYGDKGESHVTELVDDLNQVVQYGIGPGEFALAVLSQRIEGIGASSGDNEDGEGEGKGDLLIDNSPVELKTTRKNSARFNDRQVTVSDSYKTMVTAFFTKYDEKFKELEAQGLKVRVKSGMQQAQIITFLKAVPEAEKEVAEIISNIFTDLPVSGGPIARFLAQGDKNQAMQLIAQSNVSNYLTKKRATGNLAGILFLDLNKQAFTFIKEVSDLEGTGLRLHAKTNYLITTNENPFANTSIVDTGA